MKKKPIEKIETIDDIDTVDVVLEADEIMAPPGAEVKARPEDKKFKVGDIVKIKAPRDIEGNYFPIYYSSYKILKIKDGAYWVGVGDSVSAIVDIDNLKNI